MVKLKVFAHIIPESKYAVPETTALVRPGRKFVVAVREPDQWYIGALALHIKETYLRLYKQ
jgi:hypothetical protein